MFVSAPRHIYNEEGSITTAEAFLRDLLNHADGKEETRCGHVFLDEYESSAETAVTKESTDAQNNDDLFCCRDASGAIATDGTEGRTFLGLSLNVLQPFHAFNIFSVPSNV